jgi:hypothetical protein
MPEKQIFGLLAILVSLLGYAPYIYLQWKKQIKPHAFSWIIWGVLDIIVFCAQYSKGAGAGAWVTGVTSVCALTVAFMAMRQGDKNITRGDWLTFVTAFASLPLWYLTRDPQWAVLLALGIYILGYYPTFRKSYHRPHEEAALRFALSAVKSVFALFALEQYSLTTSLIPAAMIVINAAFVFMVCARRTAIVEKAAL